MSSPVEIANNFKLNVLKLIDYLSEILNSDSDILAARLVVKFIPDTTAIENFAEHSKDHRQEIETCNEAYFLNDDGGQHSLYNDFSETKVIKFKNFWSKLTDQQRDCIWKYFKYFLRLSDKYMQTISQQ